MLISGKRREKVSLAIPSPEAVQGVWLGLADRIFQTCQIWWGFFSTNIKYVSRQNFFFFCLLSPCLSTSPDSLQPSTPGAGWGSHGGIFTSVNILEMLQSPYLQPFCLVSVSRAGTKQFQNTFMRLVLAGALVPIRSCLFPYTQVSKVIRAFNYLIILELCYWEWSTANQMTCSLLLELPRKFGTFKQPLNNDSNNSTVTSTVSSI